MPENNFKNGVSWYSRYAANPNKLAIFFPEGHVCCSNCRYLYNEHGLNRCRCRLSDEIVYTPNYPELPEFCPFEDSGEIIGQKSKKEN